MDQTALKGIDVTKYFVFDNDSIFYQGNITFVRSFVSTQGMIDKDPVKMQKFVTAMYETLSDIRNNRASVVAFAKENLQMSDDDANSLQDQLSKAIGEVSFVPALDSSLSATADGLRKDTQNPDRDFAEFVYPSFAQQAAAK